MHPPARASPGVAWRPLLRAKRSSPRIRTRRSASTPVLRVDPVIPRSPSRLPRKAREPLAPPPMPVVESPTVVVGATTHVGIPSQPAAAPDHGGAVEQRRGLRAGDPGKLSGKGASGLHDRADPGHAP